MEISVLVVEDESIVALDIRTRLSSLGLDVVGHARDGATAIALAEEKRPNLVLMDIQIVGEIDGIETARIIWERFDIPSVFLTAYSDRASLDRAKQSHGYGYLLKPFQERELMIALEMALFKHRAEQQLRRKRAILDTTLNAIAEGVITTTDDQTILFMNRAAEHLTGWSLDEALGRSVDEVLVERAVGFDTPYWGYSEVHRRDGKTFSAEVTRFPIPGTDLGEGSSVVVVRDVTETLQYQQQLIDAREAAESAARAKSEFMARMSHEFRTPLNTILGMTRLVVDSASDPDVRENLSISLTSAEEMMRLVTDLLQYSAHDAGAVKVRQESFTIDDVMIAAVQAHTLEASRREVRLAVVCDPSLPSRVYGDHQRLRQILTNLVSNAVKFTPSGNVVLSLDLEEPEQSRSPVFTFTVEDTGVGIPEDKLEEVFQEFTQLEDSRTRSSGGTGLGLAIARRFARTMGGDVKIRSVPEEGTTAVCRVPLRVDETPREDQNIQWWRDARISIAASDPLIRRVLEPWVHWSGESLHVPGENVSKDTLLVLGAGEYREAGDSISPEALVYVFGPVGGFGSLPELSRSDPIYLAEPITFQRFLTALRGGCRDGGSSENLSPTLQRVRELLQNDNADAARVHIRQNREAGHLSVNEEEVLFRVSLALRKDDKESALALLNETTRRGECL